MSRQQNGQLKSATAALLTGIALALATPAHAFGWGYSPLTGSTTRMWLSRGLYNPYNLIRGGYSAPYYLANTLGWNAAYAVSQGFNAGKKNSQATNQMGMFNPPGVVDQISPAKWAAAQQNQAQAPFHTPDLSSSAPAILAPDADPFFMPVPMSMDTTVGSPTGSAQIPQTESSDIPATAPDFRDSKEQKKQKKQKKNKKQKASDLTNLTNNNQQAQQSSPAATSSGSQAASIASQTNPFANAFVEHVNARFGSDINKAFSDRETSGYARAMGLIDENSKSVIIQPERVELIRHILQDPAEDSLTKVNTIRMLIKH